MFIGYIIMPPALIYYAIKYIFYPILCWIFSDGFRVFDFDAASSGARFWVIAFTTLFTLIAYGIMGGEAISSANRHDSQK